MIQGSGLWCSSLEFRVKGFRVSGSRVRIQCLLFSIEDLGL